MEIKVERKYNKPLDEIWKDIEGYEGLYQVSNLGRVMSLERDFVDTLGRHRILRNALLKQSFNSYGYKRVGLTKDGVAKEQLVHRLVAKAFIPNPDNLNMINHKDEDKTNNYVSNLEWCTVTYNNNYGTRNDRLSIALKASFIGNNRRERYSKRMKEWCKEHITEVKERALRASQKASAINKKAISVFNVNGELVGNFSSISEAGHALGIFPQNISAHLNRKVKACKNLTFRYKVV